MYVLTLFPHLDHAVVVFRMTVSVGDEQSGLSEFRQRVYETSTGTDQLITQATQTIARVDAVRMYMIVLTTCN